MQHPVRTRQRPKLGLGATSPGLANQGSGSGKGRHGCQTRQSAPGDDAVAAECRWGGVKWPASAVGHDVGLGLRLPATWSGPGSSSRLCSRGSLLLFPLLTVLCALVRLAASFPPPLLVPR
ncbi:hypothetical protein BJY00DRAFT_153747 [Aspergillus carlsbadensis]|nr:hypothetical protein BJY00DRAFT_153747 [Aspergillus carlsbadensis]